MTHTRRIGALSALALTLVLSACSTPEDLAAPTLDPQFGTRNYDSVEDVAYGKAGVLYAVGAWDNDYDPRIYYDGGGEIGIGEAYLRQYDRSGNLVWEEYFDLEPAYEYYPHLATARAVAVDASGNALVAWSATYYERLYSDYGYYYYEPVATFNYLSKYSKSGNRLWSVNVNGNVINDLATDSSSNIYATSGGALTKYTASGARSWERVNGVKPTGVAVSSTNNVYIVREDGYVLKFNSSGTQLYTKTAALDGRSATDYKIAAGVSDELYIVGSYLYDEYYSGGCDDSAYEDSYYARLYKLSSTGVRQWTKNTATMVSGEDCGGEYGWVARFGLNVTADINGNAYTTGGNGGGDAFVTKYSRTGALSWSKAFSSGYPTDGATSVATYDGSEVFVGAVTYGSLAHRRLGGSDAVLREMNSSGTRVWTR